MKTKTRDPRKVVTGRARSTYMQTNDLRQRGENIKEDTPKTATTAILIPKKDKAKVKAIKKAIDAASRDKFGKIVVEMGDDGYPLMDGDKALRKGKKAGNEYADHYYLNARTFEKLPGLVDADNVPVDDPEERAEMCVSGYYFKFSLLFKGFEYSGKKVRCELLNMMFLEEGPRLDGAVAAEDEDWSSDDYDDDDHDDDDDDEDEDSSRTSRKRKRRRNRD